MSSQHRGMRIPRGKYKGQLLGDLDDQTVHLVWAAWNSNNASRSDPFFAVVVAENEWRKGFNRAGMRPSELESVRTADADWSETHYEWRCGDRVEWILKDVSMEGRETEECPFS